MSKVFIALLVAVPVAVASVYGVQTYRIRQQDQADAARRAREADLAATIHGFELKNKKEMDDFSAEIRAKNRELDARKSEAEAASR